MTNPFVLLIPVLLLGVSFCSSGIAAGKIKFGFNPSNSVPLLYQFENQSRPIATGGLIYEMSAAIGDELYEDYSIVRIPRKRIPKDLSSNKVDLICHNSLRWQHAMGEDVVWSKPLYTYANVLVSKKEIPFSNAAEISNARVGGIENFFYADLNQSFKTKLLERVDSVSMSLALKMLLADRLDYVIMGEIEFVYYKKIFPQLHRSAFVLDKADIQCSLSKKSELSISRLNRIIDILKKRNTFQQIYSRYMNPDLQPKPFVYGLNNNDSPPFLSFDKNLNPPVVRGGLFIDIGLEVGKRLKRPVEFAILPRGRLDVRLAEGQVDVVCYNNEVWAGSYAKSYNWSSPIFVQTNIVTSLKGVQGVANPKSISDLKGKTIGTVLNFVYPSLNIYFQNGSIIREDAGSGYANIEKLNSQRLSYVIVNNLEYNYYKNKYPNLQKALFDFDRVDAKCAVSKKSDIKIEKLNAAILDMKRQGRLQKIFFPQTNAY